jgi:tetratricopeptide (TPR) repeat protein
MGQTGRVDQPQPDVTLPRAFRWLKHVDQTLLTFVSIPLMIGIIWWRGGIVGFAIGFTAGFCAWWILRHLIAMIAAWYFGRHARTPVAKQVSRIVERAWQDHDCERAVTDLRAMITLQGEDFLVVSALAGTLADAGRLDEALDVADHAIRLGADRPELLPHGALVVKAWILRRLGRAHEAHHLIAPVVDAGFIDAGTLAEYATILADLGRLDEAEQQLAVAREKRIGLRFPMSLMFSRALRRKWREELREAEQHISDCRHSMPSAQ